MDKYEILQKTFGYASFREGQEALIDAVLSGRDAFGIMPTGSGKSVCFQVPALMLPGLTLVVSPLISLMKDQVTALQSAGVPAAFINSSQTYEEARDVLTRLRRGQVKLLYVAPERLLTESFLETVSEAPISLLAVDEAHCISQWGQDFRPSYLRIADFLGLLPRRPVVAAYTATATQAVREDVSRLLGLRDPLLVVTGFDRPNLRYDVLTPKDKDSTLHGLLKARRDKSGIIYCATRRAVEEVCGLLQELDFPATRYHAGLEDWERRQNQEDFLYDRKTVMVATNAFGMGIDKSNVSYVIHYNMPKSLEAYYQETGRAGRDGERADCILLFSPKDVRTARFLIERGSENEALSDEERAAVYEQDLARLAVMTDYCKTPRCLRAFLLDYFGQTHGENCGNCGNCDTVFAERDITRQAQMILSCVLRIHEKLGYYVGMTLVEQVLRGSRSGRVLELKLDTLSTYGLLKDSRAGRIRELIVSLEAQGYLVTEHVHQTLRPTPLARDVLFNGARVTMRVRTEKPAALPKNAKAIGKPVAAEPDGELLSALKALRMKLAREEGVPAYIIFSNATLSEMAARKPRTMKNFLAVPGVGTVKASRYGELFLREIREHISS